MIDWILSVCTNGTGVSAMGAGKSKTQRAVGHTVASQSTPRSVQGGTVNQNTGSVCCKCSTCCRCSESGSVALMKQDSVLKFAREPSQLEPSRVGSLICILDEASEKARVDEVEIFVQEAQRPQPPICLESTKEATGSQPSICLESTDAKHSPGARRVKRSPKEARMTPWMDEDDVESVIRRKK